MHDADFRWDSAYSLSLLALGPQGWKLRPQARSAPPATGRGEERLGGPTLLTGIAAPSLAREVSGYACREVAMYGSLGASKMNVCELCFFNFERDFSFLILGKREMGSAAVKTFVYR